MSPVTTAYEYDNAPNYFSTCVRQYLDGNDFKSAYNLYKGMRKEKLQITVEIPKNRCNEFLSKLRECHEDALAKDFSDYMSENNIEVDIDTTLFNHTPVNLGNSSR